MKNNTAFIKEIFSSIQGEGPHIGYKQIFIRFCGCNLSCSYCDTDHSKSDKAQVEFLSGSNNFEFYKNPLSTDDLIRILSNYDLSLHHSVSLTGGEPLLHSDFLKNALPIIKQNCDIKIFLETNGTLLNELVDIIDLIDIVSMDIKVPSSVDNVEYWDKANDFLKICIENSKDVYTKIVVTNEITDEEVENIANIMNSVTVKIPLVIQPVTTNNTTLQISPEKLFKIYDKFCKKNIFARIIPQSHRLINIL